MEQAQICYTVNGRRIHTAIGQLEWNKRKYVILLMEDEHIQLGQLEWNKRKYVTLSMEEEYKQLGQLLE